MRPLVPVILLAALVAPSPALAVVKTDAQATALVRKQLDRTPELKARIKGLKKTPFLLYVENKPGEVDSYYHLYAGEDQGDHSVRMWSFLVNPKTDEIKAYDIVEDRIVSWKAFVAAVKRGEM